MATAIATLTNIKQHSLANGRKGVEVTIDFDTGDYTANGLNLATLATAAGGTVLGDLGLRQVEAAYVVASADVNKPYTQAQWVTVHDTVTYGVFVDTATNGTPQAPRLVLYTANNVHGASALDAVAQFRIRFEGH